LQKKSRVLFGAGFFLHAVWLAVLNDLLEFFLEQGHCLE
jgi:hypothetical protein